jgi:phosphate transport system protein
VLARLADSARRVLRRSLDAFSQIDSREAHLVLGADDEIDHAQDEVIVEELDQIASHPEMASPAVDIIFIAKNLERVGDHATNIAEDVILVAEARNVKHAAKLGR